MRRIEAHLRNSSKIYRQTSSDFIEIFCPFCNDATRKSNPNHGHLYFSLKTNYFRCFRCNEVGLVTRLLMHTGFTDMQALSLLKSMSRDDINYSRKNKHKVFATRESTASKRSKVIGSYEALGLESEDFSKFYKYMLNRCLDINFSNYFIYPEKKFNKLVSAFYNYDNQFVTARFIDQNAMRYHNAKDKVLYYFQDFSRIFDYNEIVICEGVFDLINISNYCTRFGDNVFYIAMNGSSYVQTIRNLISTYLLFGHYHIHIVTDRGLIGLDGMMKKSAYQAERWNKNVKLTFYEPIIAKDVSELMAIELVS